MRPHAPPELRALRDRARLPEEEEEALVLVPGGERVRDAAAREEPREDLRARRVEPGVHVLDERRARREREDLGQEAAHSVVHRDRPLGAFDRDVHVQPEAVVAPHDVAQELVVPAVVRRVDDPLLLPVGPRVRARRAEEQAHRLDELTQLRATLGQRGGNIHERLLAPGADLDLGRDQLADEMLLERRALGGRLDLLEAVHEVERLRVEERELLLDGDREVRRVLEQRPGAGDHLLRRERLLVAHRRTTVMEALAASVRRACRREAGAARPRSPSSSAPPRPASQRPRPPRARPEAVRAAR